VTTKIWAPSPFGEKWPTGVYLVEVLKETNPEALASYAKHDGVQRFDVKIVQILQKATNATHLKDKQVGTIQVAKEPDLYHDNEENRKGILTS
jgi:hypothetical protein